jgi:hypothetical protein
MSAPTPREIFDALGTQMEKVGAELEAIGDALTVLALRESTQIGDASAVLAADKRLRLRSEKLNRLAEDIVR